MCFVRGLVFALVGRETNKIFHLLFHLYVVRLFIHFHATRMDFGISTGADSQFWVLTISQVVTLNNTLRCILSTDQNTIKKI